MVFLFVKSRLSSFLVDAQTGCSLPPTPGSALPPKAASRNVLRAPGVPMRGAALNVVGRHSSPCPSGKGGGWRQRGRGPGRAEGALRLPMWQRDAVTELQPAQSASHQFQACDTVTGRSKALSRATTSPARGEPPPPAASTKVLPVMRTLRSALSAALTSGTTSLTGVPRPHPTAPRLSLFPPPSPRPAPSPHLWHPPSGLCTYAPGLCF